MLTTRLPRFHDELVKTLRFVLYVLAVPAAMQRHGIEPAPERRRKTTWKEFLTWHWDQIVAAVFFTIEVWTPRGLQRFIILFFIELSTRKVEIAGVASNANGLWMSQLGRNLTGSDDGLLKGRRYLIHDRDPLFTEEFLRTVKDGGVESMKLPARSPNLNAFAERWVRSVKQAYLSKMILFGEASLRRALVEFVEHFHLERNHQGKGNVLLFPSNDERHGRHRGSIWCRERLGGLLRYYRSAA
jgi:putative transposase